MNQFQERPHPFSAHPSFGLHTLLATLALSVACAPDGGGDLLGEPPVELEQSPLFAGAVYQSAPHIVGPYAAAYLERGQFLARTVGASNAFQACVTNTMNDSFMNIDDPNWGAPRSVQIARAYGNFRETFAHLSLAMRPQSDLPGAGASAHIGRPGDHGTRQITFYDDIRADRHVYRSFEHPSWPWNFLVDGYVHEFVHTVGYHHSDWTCSDSENGVSSCLLHAECGWTSYCGGSGTPPPTMTFATAGDSHREFTAVKNGRRDNEYYLRGEPSAPYIYGGCAGAVFEQSTAVCGAVDEGCGPNGLRLLSSWRGESNEPQTGGSCTCSNDPRHLVSFRTSSNRHLYAAGGGGGGVGSDSVAGWGAWQAFHVIEHDSPEAWYSGERVSVKSHDGRFMSNAFNVTDTVPAPLYFRDRSGTGRLSGASMVNMFGYRDGAIRYAFDTGSTLGWMPWLTLDRRYDFQMVEPRRHLVYLSTVNGTYVNIAPDGYFYNKRTRADLSYGTALAPVGGSLDPAKVAQQAEAALWIIDWNGGMLADGDAVSFEIFKDNSWHFLSTNGNDGHVRKLHSAGPHETFIVHKLAPSSPGPNVGHRDTLSFKSSINMYLTAMPPNYFDAQIRNFVPWEGPSQRFGVEFVQHFDFDRSAWW